MGFRRKKNGERERAWPVWIHQHRETLGSIGLPLETFADLRSWDQFAEFGEVYAPPTDAVAHGFEFGQLEEGKLRELLRFLEQADEFRPHTSSLLGFLRVRLGDNHAR
jgi:hypothetical protein